MKDPAQWAIEEFQAVDLGDRRRNQRLIRVASRLAAMPRESIPTATQAAEEAKAAYRLFANENVTLQKILDPHAERTIERIAKQPVALIIQDTTELDFTTKKKKNSDVGPLNYKRRRGFLLHPSIAVTPEGLHLGTINVELWARDDKTFGEKAKRRYLDIDQKESRRWLDGYAEASKVAQSCPGTTIVNVGDRESDIFEYIDRATSDQTENAYFVVRAARNRSLPELNAEAGKRTYVKLFDRIESAPLLGEVSIDIPSRDKRKARTAELEIRAGICELKKPRERGKKVPTVTVGVVYAKEKNPPEGEDEPIEWRLLTNLPIGEFEDVLRVLEYYETRWQIEVFFRVLKSGCKVEELEFHSLANFATCLMVYMVVSWRVLNLMMLGRECPDLPCDVLLTESEWKASWRIARRTSPPSEAPKLGEMIKIIASFGGHLGRKCDGPPGPKSLWIGLQRATDFAIAWTAFGPD